jgi:hypothetical protein
MPFAWFSPSIWPVRRATGTVTGWTGKATEEFLNKLVPFRFSLWRVRAGGSVSQFDQSHDGDADLRVTHFA